MHLQTEIIAECWLEEKLNYVLKTDSDKLFGRYADE